MKYNVSLYSGRAGRATMQAHAIAKELKLLGITEVEIKPVVFSAPFVRCSKKDCCYYKDFKCINDKIDIRGLAEEEINTTYCKTYKYRLIENRRNDAER